MSSVLFVMLFFVGLFFFSAVFKSYGEKTVVIGTLCYMVGFAVLAGVLSRLL